jgi:hypothetical protein
MRICNVFLAILGLAGAIFAGTDGAVAQEGPRRIALKGGETAELGTVWWVASCKSIVVGTPTVEVLEGPKEVSLTIKEGAVIPRRLNCANPVPGGTLLMTAKDIKQPIESKLTYRINYKTRDGDRQTSNVILVSLFPK